MEPEEAYRRVHAGDWSPELVFECESRAQLGAMQVDGPLVSLDALAWVIEQLREHPLVLDDPGTFYTYVMGLGAAAAARELESGPESRPNPGPDDLQLKADEIGRNTRTAVKAWLNERRVRTKLLAILAAPRAEQSEYIEHYLAQFTQGLVERHLRPLYAALRKASGLPPRWTEGPLDAKRLREIIRRLAALDVTRTSLWADAILTQEDAAELGLVTDMDYLLNHERASPRNKDAAAGRVFAVRWRKETYRCEVLDASREGVGLRWPVRSGDAPQRGDRVWFLVGDERVPARVMNRENDEPGYVRLGLFLAQGLTEAKLGLEVGP